MFGMFRIKTVLTPQDEENNKETCFLKLVLGERYEMVEHPLPASTRTLQMPERMGRFDGRVYEYVASKAFDDGINPRGGKKKCFRSVYAATSGRDWSSSGGELPPLDLQAELERYGDFRALPNSRKVAARLERRKESTRQRGAEGGRAGARAAEGLRPVGGVRSRESSLVPEVGEDSCV